MRIEKLLFTLLASLLMMLLVMAILGVPQDWWLTPDQQGERLMAQEKFAEAAEAFDDPMRKGLAFYRAGEFEEAAMNFGRVVDISGEFNRGNALVMLGKYDSAIASYDRVLQGSPDWTAAKENRAIAVARRDRMKPESNEGGTGGMLGADEIVFDDKAKNSTESEDVEVGKGGEMSDVELRELWLQRVQTKPADFMKIKFSYQLSRMEQGQEGEK